jgi:NAD/NADP transhydrogenase alpha subunit
VLVAILKEARQDETRVALTPDAVKALTGKGITVAVESGAGVQTRSS